MTREELGVSSGLRKRRDNEWEIVPLKRLKGEGDEKWTNFLIQSIARECTRLIPV